MRGEERAGDDNDVGQKCFMMQLCSPGRCIFEDLDNISVRLSTCCIFSG